ncbi:hypothetical protein KAI92_04225 [Candidatus Parcubacteria bacterium]|nr:hypothetical protein [Candidatus Parcubacteria bacterium]
MFKRSKNNPILKPNPKKSWESRKVYNTGVIYEKGKYHLFYRAVGDDWISSIGYAISDDGEKFIKSKDPILKPKEEFEKKGLEDPRITKIDNLFYMAYAAYDGKTPRLSIATSKNLKTWTKKGFAFSDWNFSKAGGINTEFDKKGKPYTKQIFTEWSKSGGIFPKKINGKFWMLFGEHRIWFATSNNGINWIGDQKPFLKPRKGDYFDNTFVEMGPSPIETKNGWLILYHGINNNHVYKMGILLLDLKNPRKIISRSEKPIFKSEKSYEMTGLVDVLPGGLEAMKKMSDKELKKFITDNYEKGTMPKVIFCCGAILKNNKLEIFYGASDSVICKATSNLSKLLKTLP